MQNVEQINHSNFQGATTLIKSHPANVRKEQKMKKS